MSCTGFPDLGNEDCCSKHDNSYERQLPKVVADLELALCVARKGKWYSTIIALIMLLGTLTIGWIFYWIARLDKE